jgi:AcrR family transcriptional regulator
MPAATDASPIESADRGVQQEPPLKALSLKVKTSFLGKQAKIGPTRSSGRIRIQPRRRRGRPRAEDLAALEDRIVLVARQSFALNGYGATSMNTIARCARVSKSTLYARFCSKAALFREIVARQIATVNAELMPQAGAGDGSLQDSLRGYINVALKRSLSGDVLDINRLILSECRQFPELGEAAGTRFKIGVQNIARIIEQCARRDRISCHDPAAAAAVLLCAAQGWYTSIMIANRMVGDTERASWVDYTVRMFVANRSAW